VRPQLGAEPGRGLVRLGPRADLVGRPLDGLQVTDGGPTLTVEGLGAFRDVRPDRGQVPAYVQGTVPAGVAPGTLLALAVNGRVQTVATVAPEGGAGTLRFAGMLPGSSFVAGANRLEVLAVEGSGLRRLPCGGLTAATGPVRRSPATCWCRCRAATAAGPPPPARGGRRPAGSSRR
jgi:hypothetical protein